MNAPQIIAIVLAAAAAFVSLLNLRAVRGLRRVEQSNANAIEEIATGAADLAENFGKVATDMRRCRADVERYSTDVVEMKARVGRRLAELRLEKEAILKKRGPIAWFARELGWHIRPDQWGSLCVLLSVEQQYALVGLFEAADDPQFLSRWDDLGGDGTGGVVAVLRSVLDDKQTTTLSRLVAMVEKLRHGAPRRGILQ